MLLIYKHTINPTPVFLKTNNNTQRWLRKVGFGHYKAYLEDHSQRRALAHTIHLIKILQNNNIIINLSAWMYYISRNI